MPSLYRGRIVWVELADPQGRNPKRRPVIVLTPDEQITDAGLIDVAVISTQLSASLPEETVELPWHRDGHPKTKLRTRCGVVCRWISLVAVADIQSTGGFVPADRLERILEIVARLADETSS